MKVTDLFTEDEFVEMEKGGYVRKQVHPTQPLTILNYTDKAQFDQVWNKVTTTCRGLIVATETQEIVARALAKFFNYDHKETPTIDLSEPVVAMDKADGSLGILYRYTEGDESWEYAIATRGSFTSEQAIHATRLLNTKYAAWLEQESHNFEGKTPLFEIVYPENRVVLDYNGLDDLILLGLIEIETGRAYTSDPAAWFLNWPGPKVEEFAFRTFGDAIAAEPRDNAEGFVVYLPERNIHVKIKQADYLALHRIVTGLSARSVWKHMSEGKTLAELIDGMPDEFHEWTKNVWNDLEAKVREQDLEISGQYDQNFHEVLIKMGGADTRSPEFRKQFALHVKGNPLAGYFFLKLGDRPYYKNILAKLRPAGNVTPSGKTFSEDNY